MTSSYFGPNASRPVIRGLDGERVRVLQNGVGVLDASGTSVDHAVSLDPLTVRRIEIVRGPATLLYGPSAIGGVVNVIDNRIPAEALDGASGSVSARYASAARERSLRRSTDVGHTSGSTALDGFKRPPTTCASRIRLSRRCAKPAAETVAARRLPTSAAIRRAAIVAAYVGRTAYGSAYHSSSDYASPIDGHDPMTHTLRCAGEIRDPFANVRSVQSGSVNKLRPPRSKASGRTVFRTWLQGRVAAPCATWAAGGRRRIRSWTSIFRPRARNVPADTSNASCPRS